MNGETKEVKIPALARNKRRLCCADLKVRFADKDIKMENIAEFFLTL